MAVITPSLRQLQYLVALDEERHFGRTALRLGVGQSTLSAGIAELERLVGVMLVERTKRSVRFTDLGEAYVVRARSLLAASVALSEFATSSSTPLTGLLRLGIIPTIAPFLLPRLLKPLRERFPALQLHVREQTSEAACGALQRGLLDCVILALPFECGRIEYADILHDPLLLVGPPGTATATLDPGALLMLEDGHCLNDHGLISCGLPRANAASMIATSLHTLIEMVEAGLGTTFVPQLAIDAGILRGRAVETSSLGPKAERRIVVAWRAGSARGEEFALLASVAARLMEDKSDKSINEN